MKPKVLKGDLVPAPTWTREPVRGTPPPSPVRVVDGGLADHVAFPLFCPKPEPREPSPQQARLDALRRRRLEQRARLHGQG